MNYIEPMRSRDIIPILSNTTVTMICSTHLFRHYWSQKIYCHVAIGLHSKLPTVKRIVVGASVTRLLVSLPANVCVHDTHARIYTTITFSVPAVRLRHDYRYQSRTCVAPAVDTAHDTVILGQGLFMVLPFSHHQCNLNWLY